MRWWFSLAIVVGCSSSGSRTVSTSAPPSSTAEAIEHATVVDATPASSCAERVLVIERGVERGMQCPTAIGERTIVDLRDAWTPSLFAPAPDGSVPEFRATYLAIAAERDTAGQPLATTDALQELYGIVPSFAIVRERLTQQARYRCHAQIDSSPLNTLTRPFGQEHEGLFKLSAYNRRILGAQLERVRAARNLPDYAVLAADRELGPTYAKWKAADDQYSGVVAAQKHLACDGYFTAKDADGLFSWQTGTALELFQRRHFLLPNGRLDAETRHALATDPRELDFRFALRILRERVAGATGLIEDGTAGVGPQPILGRMLDPEEMRAARGHEKPLPDAAPDLISAATDAAARQLGWTDPAAAAAFLARHPGGVRVALALPRPPPYHASHMNLSAVIDRGDVYYDPTPVPRVVAHRPSIVIYAEDHGTKRALVRWPTTIGSWSDVTINGVTVQRWKESDVGPRVWRDLFAAPTWLPPRTTPDRDLVKWNGTGKWTLKRSILGPGPHGAFGIMLLPHYQVNKDAAGRERFDFNGIGTHGSATVMSIVNGTSHGCHRLFNQLAVRLGAFLLAHRDHVTRGQSKEYYRRIVRYKGSFPIKIDTRGYLYEFTPPVPVEVTRGTIRSARKIPPAGSAPASE